MITTRPNQNGGIAWNATEPTRMIQSIQVPRFNAAMTPSGTPIRSCRNNAAKASCSVLGMRSKMSVAAFR